MRRAMDEEKHWEHPDNWTHSVNYKTRAFCGMSYDEVHLSGGSLVFTWTTEWKQVYNTRQKVITCTACALLMFEYARTHEASQ